ncbi:hypothetical protein P152DRAFT_475149 [Eremomyces bilateralis CBS 781.70]|uniref:Mitochondrial porin-like protein n=1 Tax=Eremomyces bilateralis CBS 781.70 TaxID=1392243 RepID=A0A6G1FZ32_9PEZI|nr:uncharacterized protein P152DRAFT_475149 [Eremomyces bilateralis CBS 781.70]KAF1811107.1 hypothetical protein P152DRAFT_475149 [Eremomyces bilateralis CBS 781.70]
MSLQSHFPGVKAEVTEAGSTRRTNASANGFKAASAQAPPPAFADIAKPANDLINKDFYHAVAALFEVKLKTPSGVAVTTKGTSPHDGTTSGSVEAKQTVTKGSICLHSFYCESHLRYPSQRRSRDRPTGPSQSGVLLEQQPQQQPQQQQPSPSHAPYRSIHTFTDVALTRTFSLLGVTTTITSNTAKLLSAKAELDNQLAQGLKAELVANYKLDKGPTGGKLSLYFKQPMFHTRAFVDYSHNSGAVQAVVDGVVGHEGFLVGGEAGYDVQKATITRYSAALGYQAPLFSAALTALNNMSVVQASYYQKVNSAVEVGIKASYDLKTAGNVGLEIASKYKIDPLSFAKAKINDRGIASIAYNTKVHQGFTFGIGASLDTQKLNEAGHKIGTSFTFEG